MFKQLAKETALYGFARILLKAIAFLTIPYFTRVFSLADYGTISILITFQAVLAIIYSLSLESAYIRFYHDPKYTPESLLSIVFNFHFIYGASVFAILAIILSIIPDVLLVQDVRISLYVVLFSTFAKQFVNIFLAVSRMRHSAYSFIVISFVMAVSGSSFSILLVNWHNNITSYFLGYAIGNVIALVVSLILFRLPAYSQIQLPISKIWPLLRFSLPLIPASIATYLNNSLDKWTLSLFSIDLVATYSIGVTISSIVTISTSVFMTSFMPLSMKLIHRDKSEADFRLEFLLRYFSAFACCAVVLLQGLSTVFIGTFVPIEYSQAIKVVGILALSSVFFNYTYFSVLGSWKVGKPKDYSFSVVIGVCVNAILNLMLISRFGIIGAASATASGMLVTCLVSFYLAHRRFAFNYSYFRLFVTNLCSILFVLYLVNLQTNSLSSSSVPILCICAFSFIMLLNVSPREILAHGYNAFNKSKY